jgi:hypothetical protein
MLHFVAVSVTLQINVAPGDYRHAERIVAHQLRQFGAQVDEVLFTYDLHRSRGARGRGYHQGRPIIDDLLVAWCAGLSRARVEIVDYTPAAVSRVSAKFFGGAPIPKKDFVGAPYYAYFAGLAQARSDFILHLDSDMLIGGGSQSWVTEAVELLARRSDVLLCAPMAGPPTASGEIPTRVAAIGLTTQLYGSAPVREPGPSLAHLYRHATTRVFLFNRRRFAESVKVLHSVRLPLLSLLRQRRRVLPPPVAPAETTLSRALRDHGLARLDMLGKEPGMWVVHPSLRNERFYDQLDAIVSGIERGDVAEGQRGDFELNQSTVDLTPR